MCNLTDELGKAHYLKAVKYCEWAHWNVQRLLSMVLHGLSWGTPSVSSSALRWRITEGDVRVGITRSEGRNRHPRLG
jgi:hypothetical protein